MSMDEDDEGKCSICLDVIDHVDGGESVATLACGHAFHVSCWVKWAERDKATCPNCRCSLAPGEILALSPIRQLSSPPPSEPQAVPNDENCAPQFQSMSYKELQEVWLRPHPPTHASHLIVRALLGSPQHAKQLGIRANQKRTALVEQLESSLAP